MGGGGDWVRESLHVLLPPPSPPARRWDKERSVEGGGGGGGVGRGVGLGGTQSIVERIQQLDRDKKAAVAR